MARFSGKKNPVRRARVATGRAVFDREFRPARKTTLTYVAQINEPFEVDTLEGLHTGKAGDYLAIGAHGEAYPIDQDVFAETYEFDDEPSAGV
jgi:hypothetical protein